MTGLLGHDEAWRTWHAALSGGRMHHGWILAGRRGLGKASFARAAALEMLANPDAPAFSAAAHPDIVTLTPLPDNDDEEKKRDEGKPYRTKRNISVDQIRLMQRRLTTRPTLGSRRAVIVDAADDMEKGAFNALLKSLEEPPDGAVFLLVAHRPGRLPATIRSRCRMLRFAEIDDAAMAAYVAGERPGQAAEARAAAVAAAAGSPGAALEFIDGGLAPVQRLLSRIVAESDPEFGLRAELLAELGPRPDRDRQAAVLEAARAVLARALPDAPCDRQARIIEAHGEMARLIAQAPTYNFDPATLVLEIGGLLASVANPRESAG